MKHPCSVPSVPQAAARMPLLLLLLVFCTVCVLSAPSVPLASASSPVWFCPLHTVQVSADDGSSCSGECPPVPPLCCPARSPSTTEDGRLISATHYNPLTRLCTLDACDNPLYRKCGVENDGGTDCCPIGTACWVSMDIVYRCSVTGISTAFPIRTFVHQLGGPSPPVNATNAAPHCDPQMDSNGSWMDRCAHQGVCQPTLASFTCTCAAPFSGERCEIFTCPDGFVCAADAVAGIAWNSTDISAVALLCPVGSFCPRNALAPIACVDPSRCPRAGLSHFLPWREPATVCSSDWLRGTGHDGSPYLGRCRLVGVVHCLWQFRAALAFIPRRKDCDELTALTTEQSGWAHSAVTVNWRRHVRSRVEVSRRRTRSHLDEDLGQHI